MTMIRTGNPGLMVSVGWMLSWRSTICWPIWLVLFEAPMRIAWARLFSPLLVPALGADAEQCRERGGLEQHRPMIIDIVFEPGIAAGIGAGQAFENDRGAVRHDQSRPDEKDAALPEGDGAIVLTDEARALRDEEIFANRTVVNGFGDLRGNLTRQVGANAGDEGGGNDGAGLDDIG